MSLISAFAQQALKRQEQIALITDQSQMTYADLLLLVQRLQSALSARGVKPGDTIVMPNRRGEFSVGFSLLASLGAYRLIFASLGSVIEAGVDYDWFVDTSAADIIRGDSQIIMDPAWFAGMKGQPLPDYTNHKLIGSGGAFITRSSGSAGVARFICSDEVERLSTIALGPGFATPPVPGRRFATTLSPASGWAISASMAVLLTGGSVLLLQSEQEKMLGYLDLYRVDSLGTTPAVMNQLLGIPNVAQYLTGLRDVRLGGASIDVSLLERMSKITSARLHVGYGAAEMGFIMGHVYDPENRSEKTYLGHLLRDDIIVRFFDENLSELGSNVSEGLVGFELKNPEIRRRYLNADQTKRDDQFGVVGNVFIPGDIMRRDKDGGFHMIGRAKNIVNYSGNKYALDMIANALNDRFQGASHAALINKVDNGLETLLIIHTGKPAMTKEEFEKALHDRGFLIPVTRVEATRDLPMTPTGKLDVAALRKTYQST